MKQRTFVLIMTINLFVSVFASDAALTQCGAMCSGSVSPPDVVVLICPLGDTPKLADLGVAISLPFGAPVPEGSIFALEACGDLIFCVPPEIDGPPDASGMATFSGAVIGGGQTDKWLWATGWIPEPPCLAIEVDIRLVSPDIDGDLMVNLEDLSLFAMAWPPLPFDARADLNGDLMIGLVDLAIFADHYGHSCE
jgi:hypothetical protein